MTKDNSAAIDLWSQMFSRAAADPSAAIVDPAHSEADDHARFRVAMKAAGWSSDEIEAMEQARRAREASAPTSSPGVNPYVEAALALLVDDIDAAMGRLGFDSQVRVARGVEPVVGPSVAQINVTMTNESIVTVGAFFFRFCGLVARAFTRTLRLDPWLWESDGYEHKAGLNLLRRSPDIILYWMRIYLSFATTGTHVSVPYQPSTREEVLLMEQVARAMEIFAISHEYGHHHLGHGRDIEAEPRGQEFEADQFALRLCEEVDRRPVILENPYLVSGAGGAILLMALETLRSIEELMGASRSSSGTHPPCAERIARFNSVKLLQPTEFKCFLGFRLVSTRIMELVRETIVSSLAEMTDAEKMKLFQLREKVRAGT